MSMGSLFDGSNPNLLPGEIMRTDDHHGERDMIILDCVSAIQDDWHEGDTSDMIEQHILDLLAELEELKEKA